MLNFFPNSKSAPDSDDWMERLEQPLSLATAMETLDETPLALDEEEMELEEDVRLELPVDVFIDGPDIVVRTPIVGAREDEISITVNGQSLSIHKQTRRDYDVRKAKYIIKECHWGNISRTVELPEPVDASKAKAKLEHGVLTVSFPIKNPSHTKVIKIQ